MSEKKAKKKSIEETHPHIVAEWDVEKNVLSLSNVTYGSHKKAWWRCSKGHSWEAVIKNRSMLGSKCPYCTSKLALEGFNDLATTHPDLVKDWDHARNTNLLPSQVLPRSNKKARWKCRKGHSWEAVIASRTSPNPRGCPVCSGQKTLTGYNDLATRFPDLVLEWHYSKNGSLDPTTINSGTDQKMWWVCSKGHEWSARVVNRTRQGHGCPYCSKRLAEVGTSDIATTHPNILKEWDYVKNADADPTRVSCGSSQKVWWECDKGHSWEAAIKDRIGKQSGCPTCYAKTFVSKPEKELLNYVQSLDESAVGTYRQLPNIAEVDIYVPSRKIAIEYNGLYWHREAEKGKHYHYDKWLECKKQGIQLIQIWEDEWLDRRDTVERMIAHKLGMSEERVVYARKTEVVELTTGCAKEFLEANHIQGSTGGSIRLGLLYENDLVAVACFKKRGPKALELTRYSTSSRVVGGQGKLLKYIQRNYSHYEELITFADHCVSDGGMYEELGFTEAGTLPPDYKYVTGQSRKHKFGYRLKRFKEDPKLVWDSTLSESELAKLNGLNRVYDAGKTRFVLDLAAL